MLPSPSPNFVPTASARQGSDSGVNVGVGAEWIFIDLLEQIAAACETAKLESELDIEASCQKSRETLINTVTVCSSNLERAMLRIDAETVNDFKYVAAALADEVLVNLDWLGKDRWVDFLLEDYFFGTTVAGDRVFTNINRLLDAQNPASSMSCFLYLGLLGLGFEGRYRGSDDGGSVANYKKELFQRVYQRSPSLAVAGRTIIDQPYLHTARRVVQSRDTVSNWPFWFVGLMSAGALALGAFAWSHTSEAIYSTIIELLNYKVLF